MKSPITLTMTAVLTASLVTAPLMQAKAANSATVGGGVAQATSAEPRIKAENQYISLELQTKTELAVRTGSAEAREYALTAFDRAAGGMDSKQAIAILETMITTLEGAVQARSRSHYVEDPGEFTRIESNIVQMRSGLRVRLEALSGRGQLSIKSGGKNYGAGTGNDHPLDQLVENIVTAKDEKERRQLFADFKASYDLLPLSKKIWIYNSLLSATAGYRHTINNREIVNSGAAMVAGACATIALMMTITTPADRPSMPKTFMSRFLTLGAVAMGFVYLGSKPGIEQLEKNLADLEKEIRALRDITVAQKQLEDLG